MNLERQMKVNRKSKFNQMFDEPSFFNENSEFVISAELYTREQAFDLIRKEIDGWGQHADGGSRWEPFTMDDLRSDRVRYACQGYEDGYDGKLIPLCAWWLGATGRGSKPVWVLQVDMRPKRLS